MTASDARPPGRRAKARENRTARGRRSEQSNTTRRTTALAAVTGLFLAAPTVAVAADPTDPAVPEPATTATQPAAAEPTPTQPTATQPTVRVPSAPVPSVSTGLPSTSSSPVPPVSPSGSPSSRPGSGPGTSRPSSTPSSPASRRPTTPGPDRSPASTATPPRDTRPSEVTEEDAPEVREAVAALQAAEQALAAARERAAEAEREYQAALRTDAVAAAELATAKLTEQRLQQQITAIDQELTKRRMTLGSMAAHTYRMGGIGDWPMLLGAESPQDFLNRLAYLDAVVEGGNAAIRELTRLETDLKAKQRQVTELRKRQEELRAQASADLTRKAAAQQAARAAEAEVARLVQQRQAALVALGVARDVDLSRYQVRQVESGRIGQLILSLQRRNQTSGIRPVATGTFLRPATGPVTSPYGMRLHPILGYWKLHTGVDFGHGDQTVRAADDGVVIMTAYNTAYGNLTVVDHGYLDGHLVATLYAHQTAFQVKVGQRVRKGQQIGVIGSTGYSTGPHLHFEVRVDGAPVDPARWLSDPR